MKTLWQPWSVVSQLFVKAFQFSLTLFIAAYRTIGTTHLGGSCRFEPSCSSYAQEAIQIHQPGYASWLIIRRVCKCRPGGPYGYDPVPERKIPVYAK